MRAGFVALGPTKPVGMASTWHELHAVDGKTAFDFYAAQFGWKKGEGMDMGPNGIYQIFLVDGEQTGGIMTKMPEMPVPDSSPLSIALNVKSTKSDTLM